MVLFLAMNGIEIKHNKEELFRLGLAIADKKIGYDELLSWVREHKVK
jgi:prophage maintenance system killer protein